METYLGIDLGGTKLLIGEMDAAGTLIAHKKYPSGPMDQKSALAFIEQALDNYMAERDKSNTIRAMGAALIGRVDSSLGTWLQIDGARTDAMEITKILKGRYGLPCFADNDVRSATTGELRFGHGRKTGDFIYINIGTGIAAGFVTGGRIIRGGHRNSGEVGHTSVGVDIGLELPCECGRTNCVESIASGRGFDICARVLAPQYPQTSLTIPSDGKPVAVREVFEKAGSDPLCARLTDTAAKAIANLIMNLVRVSDPELVVLGGGVVSDGFLYPRICTALGKHTMRFVTEGVKLSKLDGAFAALTGACTAAMNNEAIWEV